MEKQPKIKIYGDVDELVDSGHDYLCSKCERPAVVCHLGVLEYEDSLGYKWYRIRIQVFCENCKERTT